MSLNCYLTWVLTGMAIGILLTIAGYVVRDHGSKRVKLIANRLALSLGVTVLALIPTWIWLFMYWALSPDSFWARLLTVGLGMVALGSIQLIALVILVIVLFAIWMTE